MPRKIPRSNAVNGVVQLIVYELDDAPAPKRFEKVIRDVPATALNQS